MLARASCSSCGHLRVETGQGISGIHEVTLHNWLRQDDIDHGRRPGLSSQESAELRAARGRVRQLEQEIAILPRAATWLDEEGGVAPKVRTR